ncbi:MAG: RNA polymerase primary sigma factor [Planctomycetota bacterium]|jgi:RNA polymerase primary sigma factor
MAADAYDPIELYWRDIKDSQPLSRKDEVAYFKRAKAGDEEARQVLVQANLRFVVSVAREYKDYGLSLIELVSEGNFGLLEAVKRFDETRGFKFITYAVWWIRQAILKALAEQGKIARPPMSQINDLQKIEKETGALSQALGRIPTFEEIADRVDISVARTRNAMEVSQQDVSLDAPAFLDEETTLVQVFVAKQEGIDAGFERVQMEETVHACLGVLDPRESQIVRAYFGLDNTEPMTLEEIGDGLGVTRERVRQLRNRALEKVRAQCGDLLVEFSSP